MVGAGLGWGKPDLIILSASQPTRISPMVSSKTSFHPSHFTQLVTHLQEFEPPELQRMSELYGASASDAAALAGYLVSHPEEVVEVVRDELSTSLGWRIVEEAVMEHDLGVYLDWAPARQREMVARLGLVTQTIDESGRKRAVMPAALAAIFAHRVRGQRASLPLLLGRSDEKVVRDLAQYWDLSTEGSKIDVILRICDHFVRDEMIEDIIDVLPNPDWIGDALMILELGGICFWQQVYGYDLEKNMGDGNNVVPLMRRDERRQQQDMAERLTELGVLIRFETDKVDQPMVAVPEELWGGLWELGQAWLMDWVVQAMMTARDLSSGLNTKPKAPRLQAVLKWWLCDVAEARLRYDPEQGGLAAESLRRMDELYHGDRGVDWEDGWQLGRELRVLVEEEFGMIGQGTEAEILLDRPREEFVRESLLEWCLGYSGRKADANLGEAVGLDDAWRERVVALMRRHGEPVPCWMHETGVDTTSTGGGWLREPGTGPEEIVLFEAGLTVTFVVMTKLLWLDLLSVLEDGRQYPVESLVSLMQSVAGFAMFNQLKLVLEEQPAPIYLPFQRASFLMDQRHKSMVNQWVVDVIMRLLVPLGVATVSDDLGWVSFQSEPLRVNDPPGWPEGKRRELFIKLFGDDVEFETPEERGAGIREVTALPERGDDRVSIEEALQSLLDFSKGREIIGFDGQFIEFEPES